MLAALLAGAGTLALGARLGGAGHAFLFQNAGNFASELGSFLG